MSIIAVYHILQVFELLNSYAGSMLALILCYSGGAGLGFYVGKGFFDVIPDSLIESARLDGATNLQVFTKIVLPLSKPIIVYTALTSFMGPWTDFIFARAILGAQYQERFTVSVGLYSMAYGQFFRCKSIYNLYCWMSTHLSSNCSVVLIYAKILCFRSNFWRS